MAQIEWSRALAEFKAAGQDFTSSLMKNVGKYASHLVQYIKREKLSGQVLCKYEGAYDMWRGQKIGRMKMTKQGGHYRGLLYKTFGATVESGPAIQFKETIYGRAWEFGFNRPRYFVKPVRAKALAWWTGKGWGFSKGHWIKADYFPPKPHIQPGIDETLDRLKLIVFRPFVKFLAGRGQ